MAFELRNKETQIEIQPWVSANRPSMNWSGLTLYSDTDKKKIFQKVFCQTLLNYILLD